MNKIIYVTLVGTLLVLASLASSVTTYIVTNEPAPVVEIHSHELEAFRAGGFVCFWVPAATPTCFEEWRTNAPWEVGGPLN